MATLLNVTGLSDTPLGFQRALYRQATALGLSPDYLAAVMALESNFQPDAMNPNGRALGLIQFWDSYFPPIAARAGRPGFEWKDLARLSAEEQLPFVMAYYAPARSRLSTPGDYYLQTFMPAAIGKSPDTVLGIEGSSAQINGLNAGKVYSQNRGLDVDRDGKLTVGDVTRKIDSIVNRAQDRPRLDIGNPNSAPWFQWALLGGLGVGAYWLLWRRPRADAAARRARARRSPARATKTALA